MSGDSMSGFVSAITASGALNSTTMWTEATYAVDLIVAIAVFAFGYNIVRRVIKRSCEGQT